MRWQECEVVCGEIKVGRKQADLQLFLAVVIVVGPLAVALSVTMLFYNILCLFLPKDGVYFLCALSACLLLVTAMSNQRAVKIKGQKFTLRPKLPCSSCFYSFSLIMLQRKRSMQKAKALLWNQAQWLTRQLSVATGMILEEKGGRATPGKRAKGKYSFGKVMQWKLAASFVPFSLFLSMFKCWGNFSQLCSLQMGVFTVLMTGDPHQYNSLVHAQF